MNLKLVTFMSNLNCMGKLYGEHGEMLCATMEKPWLDNRPFVSCVPSGTYDLKITNSPKYGRVYCLENEKLGVSLLGDTQRTHILIHSANYASELQGCIAVGREFYTLDEIGVSNSRKTLTHLMNVLDGESHKLTIERF